jgi:hypothetical protein
MQVAAGESAANIKAVYSERDALYLLTFQTGKQTYAFDTRAQLEDGSYRATVWDSIEPTCFLYRRNGDLLLGKTGYVAKYTGYLDDTSTYRFQYFTNQSDLGDQNITSILKRIGVIVIGGSNQFVTIKWAFDFTGNFLSQNVQIPLQGVSEYGIAEYGANGVPVAQYSNGIAMQTLYAQCSGSGRIVQTGYEADINGAALSIQKIEILTKNGRVT